MKHRVKHIAIFFISTVLGGTLLVLSTTGWVGSEEPTGPLGEAIWKVSRAAESVGATVKKKSLDHRRLNHYRQYMQHVVSRAPELERIANGLVYGSCAQGDKACEAYKLTRFVAQEIRFQDDGRGDGDHIRRWKDTYEARSGDCEDQTILLSSLLESIGMRTLMFFTPTHVYPGVCLTEKVVDGRYTEDDGTYWPVPMDDTTMYCYPLEPTVQTSRLGFRPDACIEAVYDPKTEERFFLRLESDCA